MIVVRLCGGLGNQMFQYAAGRRLAYVRKTELVLDLSWYRHIPASNTPRNYELDDYPIAARVTTAAEEWWCQLHSNRVLRRVAFLPRRWFNFREKSFEFDRSVLDLPDNTYLDGYWQSHQYFDDIADLIRAEMTPSKLANPRNTAVQIAIASAEAVSVHVRRGDYVTLKTAATMHGSCSLDYYQAALATVASRTRAPHFFVFSDDVEWARANLTAPGPMTFVDHNGPEAAFQDLRLMSLCKHHVIANSSFSWWGAWLNPGKDKIIISPKTWFADGRATCTLIPSTWMRL